MELGLGLGDWDWERERRMVDFWEGDAERMRRVPCEGEWSWRREDMRM